jgi:hypothetical protein
MYENKDKNEPIFQKTFKTAETIAFVLKIKFFQSQHLKH